MKENASQTMLQEKMPTDLPKYLTEIAAKDGIALAPFVPAGYPSLEATGEILKAIDNLGCGVIELGFPFSDPVADGPVIQTAYTHALDSGVKVSGIFDMLEKVGPLKTPVIAMVSVSIVHRVGVEKFCERAKKAGLRGLLLPDLPPPQAELICSQIKAAGLRCVLLVSPTTPPERQKTIGELADGFIYYLSVSGITGARTALPSDLSAKLRALRSVTNVPICVGFGISTAEHVQQLAGVATGAIVGSALVKTMAEHLTESPAQIAQAVADHCRRLLPTKTH